MQYIKIYEKFISSKYYIFNESDISQVDTLHRKSILNNIYVYYATPNILEYYRKTPAPKSHHIYNYIYQIPKNLNIFSYSKEDFLTMSKYCKTWESSIKSYLGLKTDNLLDTINGVLNYIEKNKKDKLLTIRTIRFDDKNDYNTLQNIFNGISN